MLRRTFLTLASATLILASCKSSGPVTSTDGVQKVKLALNWVPEPEFGGFYAARESGAFSKEKLEVEIQGGGAGVPVIQMVATGKAEFGIAGADEILTARAQGADVVALFATYQKSPQGIMTHAARGASGLKDVLASGLIALEPGLPYAGFLAQKYGKFGAKVVPYDGGVAHFLADPTFSQQCYVTSEPIAAKRNGSDPQVFLIADEGFNPYVGVVITSRAYAAQHAELVAAFTRAVGAGWATYLASPDATNAVMQKLNTSMDAETFRAAAAAQKPLIEGDDAATKGVGAMTQERWDTFAKQLTALGVLKQAPVIDFLVSGK
ncbi:MAG TPA: ABC transporter substrate-binding protein [Polyangiaceae bacterium]|jgi:NitT/TauT family transport system substrate-binding protein|nr:ABC transporter substrate-binding protein [Polyangiaceae bacterium]